MEEIIKSRIKSAGKNISNVSYLLMISNIIAFIACIHLVYIVKTDISEIDHYIVIYGLTYLLLAIFIILNIYNAGKNLSHCDIETYEPKKRSQYTKQMQKPTDASDLNDPDVMEALLSKLDKTD